MGAETGESAEPCAAADVDPPPAAADSRPTRWVLGTAGHIDHGKTTLLRALTGVDCDRLPEEKRRGLTIDIGFARLDLGDLQLDVVDVPGHERFIKNMLAGAVGVDLALLVVAADDSVMPQTREHLAILQLLGVQHGIVVITKTDRVESEWLELVEQDVRGLVHGTFLQDARIVHTAAPADAAPRGLDALREALKEACQRIPLERESGVFRLPIDRVFSVAGRGAVVTGTVWSGELQVHETVECLPLRCTLAVRGLQRHGVDVQRVASQQRAAINLGGGLHHSQLRRGQELASAGYLAPSRRLTIDLQVLADSPRAIKHRSQQRAYLGTQEVMVRIDLLQSDAVQPGQRGLAQVYCATEVVAVCGQPLVIREPSPLTTIGGGRVLQPLAAPISRRQRSKVAWLDRLRSDDQVERAEAAIFFFAARPWTDLDLCRDAAVRRCDVQGVRDQLVASGRVVVRKGPTRQTHHVHRDVWDHLQQRVVQAAERLHARTPLAATLSRPQLIHSCPAGLDAHVLEAVVDHLVEQGVLRGDRQTVAIADFAPRLSDAQRQLRDRLLAALQDSGMQPIDAAQLALAAGADRSEVDPVLQLCVTDETLVHIGDGLYLHRQADAAIRQRLRQQWPAGAGFTVSQLRDLLGTSRKFTLPICHYLDRTGFTRREGDLRRVL